MFQNQGGKYAVTMGIKGSYGVLWELRGNEQRKKKNWTKTDQWSKQTHEANSSDSAHIQTLLPTLQWVSSQQLLLLSCRDTGGEARLMTTASALNARLQHCSGVRPWETERRERPWEEKTPTLLKHGGDLSKMSPNSGQVCFKQSDIRAYMRTHTHTHSSNTHSVHTHTLRAHSHTQTHNTHIRAHAHTNTHTDRQIEPEDEAKHLVSH